MKIGELFFVLGVGEMMVGDLWMCFELASCCDVFECVGNACEIK